MRVDVRNDEDVLRALDQLADELDSPELFIPAAERVRRAARSFAPVRTGSLRASISLTRSRSSVSVVARSPYALYQEFGTRKMRANPFLRPAVKRNAAAIASDVEDAVDTATRKAGF